MALPVFATIILLWLALIPIAFSASATLIRANRRDRFGLVDSSACGSISTAIFGPVIAAVIVFALRLTLTSATPDNTDTGGQIGQAWAWVAAFVVMFWLYALATAIFATSTYYIQQRRIRAVDPNA